MSYNGFTTYETALVAFWIGFNSELYQAKLSHFRCNEYTAQSAMHFVKGIIPQGTPAFNSPADYEKVDWEEIAQSWRDE